MSLIGCTPDALRSSGRTGAAWRERVALLAGMEKAQCPACGCDCVLEPTQHRAFRLAQLDGELHRRICPAMPVAHPFVSAVADGADATLVRPSRAAR